MSNGKSGPSSPLETDEDGGGRVHQRRRSRSLLQKLGFLSVATGAGAILLALLATYQPETANPVEVTANPVLGLTGIASGGILLILLGFLAYYFSLKAGI